MWAENSVRLLLTKNPARSFNCLFRRSSSGVTRLWFACTGASDEQMRPGREPLTSTRGVNTRVLFGLESHLGPVRHEWFYRIAPKIIETHKPSHDDNVGTQSATGGHSRQRGGTQSTTWGHSRQRGDTVDNVVGQSTTWGTVGNVGTQSATWGHSRQRGDTVDNVGHSWQRGDTVGRGGEQLVLYM